MLFPLPTPDCSRLISHWFPGKRGCLSCPKLGKGVGSMSCPVKCAMDTVLSSLHDPSNLPQPSVNMMTTEMSHDQCLSQAIITCITLFLLAACPDPLAGYAHLSNGSSHPKLGMNFEGCIRRQLLLPWMGLHSPSPPSLPAAACFAPVLQ